MGKVWAASPKEGPIHFSIPHVWTKEGSLQIQCRRVYNWCGPYIWPFGRTCTENSLAGSISNEKKNWFHSAYRVAGIQSPPPSQDFDKDVQRIKFGTSLILQCKVQNLARIDDHTCQWRFSASNDSEIITINTHTLTANGNVSRFWGGRLLLNSGINHQKDVICKLEIPETTLVDEGYWSCAPQNDSRGWIKPSPFVEVKLIDACTNDTQCNSAGNTEMVCQVSSSLHKAANTPLKSCIHACNTSEGSQVCGNLTNAVCEYHAESRGSVRCVCEAMFVLDTGFKDNHTKCVKQCSQPEDCPEHETCIPGLTTPRCLKICKAYPCGAHAHCLPSEDTRNRTCSCNDRTYPIDASLGAERGCKPPSFLGLQMLLIPDDESASHQECKVNKANGTESCTFVVPERANVSFICNASQTFPLPHLNVTSKRGNSAVHLEYARDTSIPKQEEGQHEPSISMDTRSGPIPDGAVKATLWNVTKANHNGAIMTCHLFSDAHKSQIHVTLTVAAQNSDAANLSTWPAGGEIAGIAIAVVLVLVLLVLMAIFAFTKFSKILRTQNGKDNTLNVVNDASNLDQNEIPLRRVTATPRAPSNNVHGAVGQPQDDGIYEDINCPPTPDVAAAVPNINPSNWDFGNQRKQQVPATGVTDNQHLPALPPKVMGQQQGQRQTAEEKSHDDLLLATLDLSALCPSGAHSSTSLLPAPGPAKKGVGLDLTTNVGKFKPMRADEEECTYATIVGEMVDDVPETREDS